MTPRQNPRQNPRIAVVGSVNVDIVVRSARLPGPGETLHGDSFALALGGKGANQACAAARLGADVTFIGCIGTDAFGDFALEKLGGFGLARPLLRCDPAAGTGIATIAIDSAGQNAITVVAGANASLSLSDIESARASLESADVLLLQCETPFEASIAAARIVKQAGGQVILDPAPAPEGGIPSELADLVDFVTPNETEAFALTGIQPTDRETGLMAAAMLRADCGFPGAVVKLGGKGLVWSVDSAANGPGGEGFLPPFPVKVVDTVAAGDCFNAGFAYALAQGTGESSLPNLEAALRFASACGALAVTRPGAAEAAPLLQNVHDFIAAQPAGA